MLLTHRITHAIRSLIQLPLHPPSGKAAVRSLSADTSLGAGVRPFAATHDGPRLYVTVLWKLEGLTSVERAISWMDLVAF
jgi:hypothetical protein